MRVAPVLWGLVLGLCVEGHPAPAPAADKPTQSLNISLPKSSVSNPKRAQIICDSKVSDVFGKGTGKSGVQIWKEADMDSFLSVFDKLPPYSASLPETLGDLGHAIKRPACTIYECKDFDWEEPEKCTSHNGENALWYEVYNALANYRIFMEGFKWNMNEAGNMMTAKAADLINHLSPIKLSDAPNAGFSIFITSVIGSIAPWFWAVPALAASIGGLAGGFGLVTGAITQIGTQNDKNIIKHMQEKDSKQAWIAELTDAVSSELDKFAEKVLEDKPQNSKDKPYSSYDWSASQILKGGSFADPPASNITADIGEKMKRTLTTGIIASQMDKMMIGKATKKMFGEEPCDVDVPPAIYRHCIGSTAYFFARASYHNGIAKEWDYMSDWSPFKSIMDEDNKSLYMGITLTDIINESSNSQHRYGWSKTWDLKDNGAMDVLLDQAKSSEPVSMFNYPILELDPCDQEPPCFQQSGSEEAGFSYVTMNHDERFKFLFWQAAAEQKSKGRDFPWKIWDSDDVRKFYYTYNGEKKGGSPWAPNGIPSYD